MKNKFFTLICAIMLLVPWTILPLRQFDWALASPTAEIMISGYAAFMILSGIFTAAAYFLAGARNAMMKVCLVVNLLYAMFGIAAFGLMAIS